MEQSERIGVSLPSKLLADFDSLIKKRGYPNRSEAFRDLIRNELSTEQVKNPNTKAVGAVCLAYNQHQTKLMEKLTALQHSHLLKTICSTHIHLDKHECMEIIILKGKVSEINKLGEQILSQKGVKLGKISLIAAD